MRLDHAAGLRRPRCADQSTEAAWTSEFDAICRTLALLRDLRPLRVLLSARDFRRVERTLQRLELFAGPSWLTASLLRAKIKDAQVVLPEDLPPSLATGDSRVTYAVDGRQPETRLLHFAPDLPEGQGIPVLTPLGATLLGMRAGERAPLLRRDGAASVVHLQATVQHL